MGLFKFIKRLRYKYKIGDVEVNIERNDLIRRSRILFIDDEEPELINDLKKSNFSVDHEIDITPENAHLLEPQKYDLILLDFGDVGSKFGNEEGLSLLRHIKRVNPIVVIISYTSKAIPAKHADFYKLADGTLSKDAGIADSMEKIEDGLKKAHSIERIWIAFLKIMCITQGSDRDLKLQNEYVRALKSDKKRTLLMKKITGISCSDTSNEIAQWILSKLIEIGVKGIITAIV